jgi:hypothetical protein
VAAEVGYLVSLSGEEAFVCHGDTYRESVTVLDDAVGFVRKEAFDQAQPEQTVVVFIGGDPAPVQLIVEKRRLEIVTAGIEGGRS